MDDHTISIVRESFDLVEPIAAQAGRWFYANWRQIDPSLQQLLLDDPDGEATMRLAAGLIERLDRPAQLRPLLHALAARLAERRLGEPQWTTALAAALQTLHRALGVAYNQEVEEAWQALHAEWTATMTEASRLPA